MTTTPETNQSMKQPMLQINRINHLRISAKILDSTDEKLKQYLQFAAARMDTKITNDDVVEYALNLLFERDTAFRFWLKKKP
ncbi:MAG: hypothetical protein KF855_17140 [Acidobacteria bacterium]|nr:hypothetical protein [Acidobacteriota bacterium]